MCSVIGLVDILQFANDPLLEKKQNMIIHQKKKSM